MHSSTGRRDFIEETNKSVNGKSGRTTSVTIGSPRNRQVIIYDKRSEIIHSGKTYWWGIWNDTFRNKSIPLLTFDNPKTCRVWRVEFRAGKDLLKDRWNIRTWAQLNERFGDLCRETGEVVRYCVPNPSDPNRARWPNDLLWELVCAEMNDDLCEMRSGCDPNPLKEVHKENHISMITRQITGSVITLAALNGKSQKELPEFLQKTANEMSQKIVKSPEKTRKQLQSAKDRYVFIEPQRRASDQGCIKP